MDGRSVGASDGLFDGLAVGNGEGAGEGGLDGDLVGAAAVFQTHDSNTSEIICASDFIVVDGMMLYLILLNSI